MATLHLPHRLMAFIQKTSPLHIQDTDLKESLQKLTTEYSALKPYLFDEKGNYASAISIFINEQRIDHTLQYLLKPADHVEILVNLAGG